MLAREYLPDYSDIVYSIRLSKGAEIMKCANYGGIIENTDYVCPYCGEDLKGPNAGFQQTTHDDKTYLGDFHLQDDAITTEEKTVLL